MFIQKMPKKTQSSIPSLGTFTTAGGEVPAICGDISPEVPRRFFPTELMIGVVTDVVTMTITTYIPTVMNIYIYP